MDFESGNFEFSYCFIPNCPFYLMNLLTPHKILIHAARLHVFEIVVNCTQDCSLRDNFIQFISTWPTPSFKVPAIFILNEITQLLYLFVHVVVGIFLYMGVNDCHHLTTFGRHIFHHIFGIRELLSVPSEIAAEND